VDICRKELETRRILLTLTALVETGYQVDWTYFFCSFSNIRVSNNNSCFFYKQYLAGCYQSPSFTMARVSTNFFPYIFLLFIYLFLTHFIILGSPTGVKEKHQRRRGWPRNERVMSSSVHTWDTCMEGGPIICN
jgi:hypothetical protein